MNLNAFQQHASRLLSPLLMAPATVLLNPFSGDDEAGLGAPAPDSAISRQFQARFNEALAEAFERLKTPRKKFVRDESQRFSDTLSLVGHHELERQLLIERHTRNLPPSIIEPLQYLSIRLERLSNQTFELSDNPLHPRQLALAIEAACAAISKDSPATHAALERWLQVTRQHHAKWLNACNDWLIEQNVMPWLDHDSLQERYLRREAELEAARQLRKETLSQITGKPLGENDALPSSDEVLKRLSSLIQQAGQTDSAVQAHIPTHAPDAEQATHAEILAALRKINSLDLSHLARADSGYAEAETRAPLSQVLTDSPDLQGKALDDSSQSTVALLSMVFERFQNDEAIASPVRALMNALQVPMLQSALADEEFLVKADNPAQQLLNEIGRLGLQWTGKASAAQDALYKKLESVVEDIQARAHEGRDAFEDNLNELQYFVAAEERKAALINERSLASEHARARLENATRESRRAITSRVNHQALPSRTADFIQDSWQRVLFFLYNRDPEARQGSTRDGLSLLDELLSAAQGHSNLDVDDLIHRLDQHMILAGREEPIPKLKLAALNRELKTIAAARFAPEPEAEPAASTTSGSTVSAETAATAADTPTATPVPDAEISGANETADTDISDTVAQLLGEFDDFPDDTTTDQPAVSDSAAPEHSTPDSTLESALESQSTPTVTLVQIDLEEPEDDSPIDTALEDDFDRAAALITPNSWFIYLPDDETSIKVKLAAIIKYNMTYVFINRDGAKILTDHISEVASKLRLRQLQLIESGAVFERTLANIISGMRQ